MEPLPLVLVKPRAPRRRRTRPNVQRPRGEECLWRYAGNGGGIGKGRRMLDSLKPSAAGWDANSPPDLEFLFEARVKLHLPALDVGPTPDGQRVIFFIKGGTFEGPHLRGRVVLDAGADWVRIRPDGTGVLDVRFCLETHDNAMLYLHWQGRFWSAPEDAEYAIDLGKPDDPAGAWRYYFRAAPQFETGDARYS